VKAHAKTEQYISFLMPGLREQFDPRQELYRLAEGMPWEVFENELGALLQRGMATRPSVVFLRSPEQGFIASGLMSHNP
jgi:hypothetical protein